MIKQMTHVSVPVLDQESAKRFYTEKLGFDVRADVIGVFNRPGLAATRSRGWRVRSRPPPRDHPGRARR